jgi:hypothetical protein
MRVSIEKEKLERIIEKIKDAISYLDNGEYLYEEYHNNENEDIVNELDTAETILLKVVDELEELVKQGEEQ